MSDTYYKEVGAYYDDDARDFEERYWDNPVLQRIRQSFREEVKRHKSENILEVGFGPGFDLTHFARILPESNIYGVDVSVEMVNLAQAKIDAEGLSNAKVAQGSVEHIADRFPGVQYDMIYVFFGALNTVDDLELAAKHLQGLLTSDGKMVLTFVNKWFIAGMGIELLKLRVKSAFSRLKPIWGGYSPTKYLASKCYSPSEVKKAFAPLKCTYQSGYSIIYPAWYYHGIHRRLPQRLLRLLWQMDRGIAQSKPGTWGEYMLYRFEANTASSMSDTVG